MGRQQPGIGGGDGQTTARDKRRKRWETIARYRRRERWADNSQV